MKTLALVALLALAALPPVAAESPFPTSLAESGRFLMGWFPEGTSRYLNEYWLSQHGSYIDRWDWLFSADEDTVAMRVVIDWTPTWTAHVVTPAVQGVSPSYHTGVYVGMHMGVDYASNWEGDGQHYYMGSPTVEPGPIYDRVVTGGHYEATIPLPGPGDYSWTLSAFYPVSRSTNPADPYVHWSYTLTPVAAN